jgi:hypothetical protein
VVVGSCRAKAFRSDRELADRSYSSLNASLPWGGF